MNSSENITISIEELDKSEIYLSNEKNVDETLDDIFSISKKKKKKSKDDENIKNKELEVLTEEQNLLAEFDLNLKEKKKKKKDKKNLENSEKQIFQSEDYDPPIYSYIFLLNRLYDNFTDKENSEIHKKNTIKMPNVQRMSSKKTGWMNFKECCSSLNRDITHLQSFVINELSAECNIDGNGFLIIKGIYNQKNIENVLRKYVVSYVQCLVCKSLETMNRKDTSTRISFLECTSCKSNRALQQINLAFKSNKKQ